MIVTWAMRFREQLQESVLEKERGVEVHQFVVVSFYPCTSIVTANIDKYRYNIVRIP